MKAFTLIELLVVLVIIGILTSMLLSSVSKAKKAATMAQCHNFRRQLTIYYYAGEYDAQEGPSPSDHDIEKWNIRHELMLDHRIIQSRCYDCHATIPR